MNCKPGDLAVIVRGRVDNSNVGAIVEVVGPAAAGDINPEARLRYAPTEAGPYWWIRTQGRPLMVISGGRVIPLSLSGCSDSRLRPIRDQDGADETLTWAGKPSEVTA